MRRLKSRTLYPGLNIRHEVDFGPLINRVWVEPPDALIAAMGPDLFARFARAFNVAERLEGVHHALFMLLKSRRESPDRDREDIGFENARTTLVRVLWGYTYEAAPPLRALGVVAPIVMNTAARESHFALQATAKRWSDGVHGVVRNAIAFHAGEHEVYERAVKNLPPNTKLVLTEEQATKEGVVHVGAHRFPFAFDLLGYGLSKGEPHEVELATKRNEELREWIEEWKTHGLELPLHLMSVLIEVLRHHGVNFAPAPAIAIESRKPDGTVERRIVSTASPTAADASGRSVTGAAPTQGR